MQVQVSPLCVTRSTAETVYFILHKFIKISVLSIDLTGFAFTFCKQPYNFSAHQMIHWW